MPRYLVVRKFDVAEDEMPEVGRRSRDLGRHTLQEVLEIVGDVTPADFPP